MSDDKLKKCDSTHGVKVLQTDVAGNRHVLVAVVIERVGKQRLTRREHIFHHRNFEAQMFSVARYVVLVKRFRFLIILLWLLMLGGGAFLTPRFIKNTSDAMGT